jgi:uncharacterized membrane protein YhhN
LELPLALVIFGALLVVSLLSADKRWPAVFMFAKPATTLALLCVTGLPSHSRFGVLVVGALLLSALGDTALLHESRGFFLAGVFLFLLAHLGYTAAFVLGGGAGELRPQVFAGVGVMACASLWLLTRIWKGVDPMLRPAVFLYAVVITGMVGAAYLVLAGPWPSYIAVSITAGAVLFYLGDALLAWGQFGRPLRHSQALNLIFYWSGQLGLALAARWVGDG